MKEILILKLIFFINIIEILVLTKRETIQLKIIYMNRYLENRLVLIFQKIFKIYIFIL